MAPLLQSTTTPSDGHAIVTVRGDLDTDTAAQLWQYLGYLISQGHHHIVLDLRGMILIDSAGIDVLARVSAWTHDNGGDLVLRSASPDLAEQLNWRTAPKPAGVSPQLGASRHRRMTPTHRLLPKSARRSPGCDVLLSSCHAGVTGSRQVSGRVTMSAVRRDSSAP
jgi:anti-anti-sigma factor